MTAVPQNMHACCSWLAAIMKFMLNPHRAFTVKHKTLTGEKFVGFRSTRTLVEKILVADHTNNSSLLEFTTFGG